MKSGGNVFIRIEIIMLISSVLRYTNIRYSCNKYIYYDTKYGLDG